MRKGGGRGFLLAPPVFTVSFFEIFFLLGRGRPVSVPEGEEEEFHFPSKGRAETGSRRRWLIKAVQTMKKRSGRRGGRKEGGKKKEAPAPMDDGEKTENERKEEEKDDISFSRGRGKDRRGWGKRGRGKKMSFRFSFPRPFRTGKSLFSPSL